MPQRYDWRQFALIFSFLIQQNKYLTYIVLKNPKTTLQYSYSTTKTRLRATHLRTLPTNDHWTGWLATDDPVAKRTAKPVTQSSPPIFHVVTALLPLWLLLLIILTFLLWLNWKYYVCLFCKKYLEYLFFMFDQIKLKNLIICHFYWQLLKFF